MSRLKSFKQGGLLPLLETFDDISMSCYTLPNQVSTKEGASSPIDEVNTGHVVSLKETKVHSLEMCNDDL